MHGAGGGPSGAQMPMDAAVAAIGNSPNPLIPSCTPDLKVNKNGTVLGGLAGRDVRDDERPVHVLSRRHLVQNKRATGRLQDLPDIERLESGE